VKEMNEWAVESVAAKFMAVRGIHEVSGKGDLTLLRRVLKMKKSMRLKKKPLKKLKGLDLLSRIMRMRQKCPHVKVVGKGHDKNKFKDKSVEVRKFEAESAESKDKNEVKMKIERFPAEPDDVAQSSLPEVTEATKSKDENVNIKILEFQEKFDEEFLSGQSEDNGNLSDEISPDRYSSRLENVHTLSSSIPKRSN
jgi:hypothetical protein